LPGWPSNPKRQGGDRSPASARIQVKALARDADLEAVRALPGWPSNPKRQGGDRSPASARIQVKALARDADLEAVRALPGWPSNPKRQSHTQRNSPGPAHRPPDWDWSIAEDGNLAIDSYELWEETQEVPRLRLSQSQPDRDSLRVEEQPVSVPPMPRDRGRTIAARHRRAHHQAVRRRRRVAGLIVLA